MNLTEGLPSIQSRVSVSTTRQTFGQVQMDLVSEDLDEGANQHL